LRNICEKAGVRNSLHLLLRVYAQQSELPPHPRLTPCENRLLRMLAEGYSSQETARHLQRSPHTVKTQRQNILEKLNVNNSRAALAELLNHRAAIFERSTSYGI
jgi:two-component system nitrate/nitrite response regulator NarL